MTMHESQWNQSKINEHIWKSMKMHDKTCKSMKINQKSIKNNEINENQWKSMKINENQWKSLKINGNSMENQWKSIHFHWEFYRNSMSSELKVDAPSQLRLKLDRKTCLWVHSPVGNHQGTSGDVQSSRYVSIRDSLNVCTTYSLFDWLSAIVFKKSLLPI